MQQAWERNVAANNTDSAEWARLMSQSSGVRPSEDARKAASEPHPEGSRAHRRQKKVRADR